MEIKEKIKKYSIGSLVLSLLVLGMWFLYDRPEAEVILTKSIKATTTTESILNTTNNEVDSKKEKLSTISTSSNGCENSSAEFDCYYHYFKNLIKEKGTAFAFTDLKKRYETNAYVRSQCHPITHVIGRITAESNSKVSEIYKQGDPFCWSGFYHGVMEQVVQKVGLEKVKNDLNNICDGVIGKEKYSFDYYNCVHGLGHGLMAATENELFDSLKYCDNLIGEWEKNSCYGGVFMENVIVDNKNHFTKYLKPTEPLYPCNAVENQYKYQCYLMQTSYMLKVQNNDFAKVFGLCRGADNNFQNVCFQSLGRDASGHSLSNIDATWAKCSLGANYIEQSNCVVGAVKDIISYYHSDVEAKNFCEIVSSDLNEICLETATAYFKTF